MIGALLGKYRILSKLGEGGMGVVYVGRHETLGNSVVVKVLQPELSRNAEMVQRFFNEAQAATAISSLGIVQVFDFGTTAEGCAYFVMELLHGQNLGARLRQGRLGYVECCRIGRQIANVLQAAHAVGITHRDLKPENLFLVPDPEAMGGERVKVLDFGIAKLAGQIHTGGVRTRTGLIMGTPHYMSPEQCRGAGAVDARSDIYSLGCILFEMACGRPPFIGEGDGEVLGAHQYLEPPYPQSFAPDMPPRLAALIVSMLEKRAEARPPTMAAVSQALDEILQTLGAQARTPTPLQGAPASPLHVPAPTPFPAHVPTPPPVPAAMPQTVRAPMALSVPSPTPVPALPGPPSSTTLGGAAGVAQVQERGPRHRFSLVVGGFVAAGAVAAIVLVGVTRDADAPARAVIVDAATVASVDPGAADARRAEVGPPALTDAHEAQVSPPAPADAHEAQVSPPPPVDAAVTIDARGGDLERGLESECRRYQANQSWTELDACAERLKAVDAEAAKVLKARAALEIKALPRIAAFEAALRAGSLKKAKSELELIPGSATAYARLQGKYGQAEDAAIHELIKRLERAKDSDCKAYEQILQQEKQLQPPRVAAEAVRKLECQPVAAICDHDALAQKGKDLYSSGKLADALESYEAAWSCRPDPADAEKAFIVACNLANPAKAKVFWKRMSESRKRRSLPTCERNQIGEQILNAP